MTTIQQRKTEAKDILRSLGLPKEQLNDRTAICLLALLDLPSEKNWDQATSPRLGIRAILDFAREKMEFDYAENTRESVRKYSVKQLVSSGIATHNPDDPARPVNSSKNCYQIEISALELFKKYGSDQWETTLKEYLSERHTLVELYARDRATFRIPVQIKADQQIQLSPGPHSELIGAIIHDFGSIFVPDGELVYVGDTGAKWGYFDNELLLSLGVVVGNHGKMPDAIFYDRARNWIILVEAVTSSGPVDGGRHNELRDLFGNSTAGLVYVTAFPDRGEVFKKYLQNIAWETEVWCASDPTHLIHFNGVRYLGPHDIKS